MADWKNLGDRARNLTLAGLGNTVDEPFARIEKADLAATIQVSPWNTGAGISETI